MASDQQDSPKDGVSSRSEVIEFGHIPVCPWLSHLISLVSLQSLLRDLLIRGQYDTQQNRCMLLIQPTLFI